MVPERRLREDLVRFGRLCYERHLLVAMDGNLSALLPDGSILCTKADRKSTRLNSSHLGISYAVFCLKKKTTHILPTLSPSANTHLLTPPPTSRASHPSPLPILPTTLCHTKVLSSSLVLSTPRQSRSI